MNDPEVKVENQKFDIPSPIKIRPVVDFQLCVGIEELRETLYFINQYGYTFLTATQNDEVYTVFFRRPA